jgi:hypothetical protein
MLHYAPGNGVRDLEKVWAAESELKRSRVVPARIGLSLLLRIGSDPLSEALETDRNALLFRAAKVAKGEVVDR